MLLTGQLPRCPELSHLSFTGPARVFNSEEETTKAIMNDEIRKGDVVVIRYVGPKGGPGMPEMLSVTAMIIGKGLEQMLH